MKQPQSKPISAPPPATNQPVTPATFTEKEAAIYLGVSPQFLRLSRHYGNRPGHGASPPYIKLGGGRSIRYLREDLDVWLKSHRYHPATITGEDDRRKVE